MDAVTATQVEKIPLLGGVARSAGVVPSKRHHPVSRRLEMRVCKDGRQDAAPTDAAHTVP
jgi:hypothetical protein